MLSRSACQHSPHVKHFTTQPSYKTRPSANPTHGPRASPRVLHHGGALGVQNHQPRSLGDAVRREELHDDFLGIPGPPGSARVTGDG